MNYNFIKYERDFQRGEANISISASSTLRFSAKFCKITNITSFHYALLFFDSEKKAIGILPINKIERASFKITKEKHSASISIEGFMKKNNLDAKKYRGNYEWIKEKVPSIGEVYIINLNK